MNKNEYKKLAKNRDNTSDVRLPSGAVFKCRRPLISHWVQTGLLPEMFGELVAKAEEGKGDIQSLSAKEKTELLACQRQLVQWCCVDPELALPNGEKPLFGAKTSDSDDPFLVSDLDPEDFEALALWAWTGGEEAEKLKTFPEKKSKPAATSAHG